MSSKKRSSRLRPLDWSVIFIVFVALLVASLFYFKQDSSRQLSCPNSKSSILVQREYYDLCFNKETKQPNWVLQVLQNEYFAVSQEKSIADFYQDLSIPTTDQASSADYIGSNWVIGNYLFPLIKKKEVPMNEENSNANDEYLFSVTSPQNKEFNRGYWEILRKRVLALAEKPGGVGFVVVLSGPLFWDADRAFLEPGHIPVPSHFFQVIAPSTNTRDIEVYVVPNKNIGASTSLDTFKMSVKEFEKKTGIQGITTLGGFIPESWAGSPTF